MASKSTINIYNINVFQCFLHKSVNMSSSSMRTMSKIDTQSLNYYRSNLWIIYKLKSINFQFYFCLKMTLLWDKNEYISLWYFLVVLKHTRKYHRQSYVHVIASCTTYVNRFEDTKIMLLQHNYKTYVFNKLWSPWIA